MKQYAKLTSRVQNHIRLDTHTKKKQEINWGCISTKQRSKYIPRKKII